MTIVTPSIRRYRLEDSESVMRIWRRANAVAHPFLSVAYVAQVEQEVRDHYVPKAETYVVEEDRVVVGFISLLGNEIGGLFVDPSKHGRGYGKALVDHASAIKGSLNVEVFRDNAIGRPFYQRCGFVFVTEGLHEPSSQVVCKLAMPPF